MIKKNTLFRKSVFVTLIIFFAIILAVSPVSAGDTVLDQDLSYWIDTGDSHDINTGSSQSGDSYSITQIGIKDVSRASTLNYLIVEKSGGGSLPDGRTMAEYTLGGKTNPCAIDVTTSRNLLGQVTKTRYTFWFYYWSIGTLTGSQTITLNKTLWTGSGVAKSRNTGDSNFFVHGSTGQYSYLYPYPVLTYSVTYSSGIAWKQHLKITEEYGSSYYIDLQRVYGDTGYYSTVSTTNSVGSQTYENSGNTNVTTYLLKSDAAKISVVSPTKTYEFPLAAETPETPNDQAKFSLSLSTNATAAGDTIQGTVDTTGLTYDSLHYFIDGREHITTDNPYSFIATGEVGKEYMVYVDAYYQGSFTGDSTNYIMYEITEGVSLENQYSLSLDKDIYTQGETAIGILDDSSATDLADEIIWKVIPMQDSVGDMSTVSGFKVDYEKNGAGWLKNGEGNYTYEEAKTFSHLLDGYGEIQIEADVYNATKGLVALPYESAYVNPASWYRNAYVYLYADGGLYQGEAHITTTYILRDESTTYVTYTGYKQITVVRGGDYTIHIDLEDNSKYNDVDMVYSNYVADEKIRVYLEENYTKTEYAKLTARIVDTSGVPIYGATVKIAGSTYTSGDEGQVIYYGLDNSTVSIIVSKEGYQTIEATTTLIASSNSITITLPLISEVTVTVTPTPTATGESDSGLDTNSPFYNFYRIFMSYGLSEEMAGIAIAMSVCGVLFLLGVKFAESTSGGLAGAVVGIIFCSIAGLIPMWVIMTIILISAAVLATKMYGDGK